MLALVLVIGLVFTFEGHNETVVFEVPRDELTHNVAPEDPVTTKDEEIAAAEADLLPVHDEYLDLIAGFGRHTYRELLSGIEDRLVAVEEALRNPRCVVEVGQYDLAAAEECKASEIAKLGHLIQLCDLVENDPPEKRLRRGREMLNQYSPDMDQERWYYTQDVIDREYRSFIVAADQCDKFQSQIAALPTLKGFVDFGDYSPITFAKTASYVEQAARLGYVISFGEYAVSVNLLTAGILIHTKEQGGVTPWSYLLEQQAKSEEFLKALIPANPVEGLMELVMFEKMRLPLDVNQRDPEVTQGFSDAQYADQYRRMLTYYFAAEYFSDQPLGEFFEIANLDESERYLDVNDIELARNNGFWMAEKYR